MSRESNTKQEHCGDPANKKGDEQRVQHQLTVYVTTHCTNCAYATEVAVSIRRTYPQTIVRVVDLADPCEPVPDIVFATPTYLLDGRIWSLGNPSAQQIHASLG
jgi:hypothetical protein